MTQQPPSMSAFDDNPFADPFAEPSIQQATRGSSAQNGLEEYDPFGDRSAGTTTTTAAQGIASPPTYVQPTVPGVGAGGGLGGGQPATVTPTSAPGATMGPGGGGPPPSYAPSAQQQVTTAEFQRRQEELEKKAQELARKEEELRNAGSAGARQDNWPPLPSACPVGPCFYQDISVDIPLEFQKIVRMLYYLWMFHALMLLLNILGGLGVFVAFGSGSTFGLAILYFFIFTPFSYICWFRPVYKAFRSDSSFNFMVFFFVFSFQLIVSVMNAIGVPSMGTCGFVLGLTTLGNDEDVPANYIVGIMVLMIALGFAAVAAVDAILLIKVHRIYRSTGASFAKAQAEFSQGVMGNEHVQNAASNAASHAVRSQLFAGGGGGGGGGGGFGTGGVGTGVGGGGGGGVGVGPRF